MKTFEVETPQGPARVHLHPATEPWAALVLGHGAGGGVAAPDLVATRSPLPLRAARSGRVRSSKEARAPARASACASHRPCCWR
jgi:hypothetical protein